MVPPVMAKNPPSTYTAPPNLALFPLMVPPFMVKVPFFIYTAPPYGESSDKLDIGNSPFPLKVLPVPSKLARAFSFNVRRIILLSIGSCSTVPWLEVVEKSGWLDVLMGSHPGRLGSNVTLYSQIVVLGIRHIIGNYPVWAWWKIYHTTCFGIGTVKTMFTYLCGICPVFQKSIIGRLKNSQPAKTIRKHNRNTM